MKLIAITTIVYWIADPIVTILDNTALFFKIYPRLWTIQENDYANLHLLQFSVIFLYAWGLEFKSERFPIKLISPITAFGVYYLVILTCGGSGYIGCWDFSNRVPALISPVIAIITYELIFEEFLPLLQDYSKSLLQKNPI